MNPDRQRLSTWGRIVSFALVVVASPLWGSSAIAGYAPGCTVALGVAGSVAHEFRDVAVQPDGKIVAAGYVEWPGGDRDFLLARFHPDLSLDTSFAAPNGYVTRDVYLKGEMDEAFAVLVQHDQKIVIAGYADFNATKRDMGFARYNPDGTLDAVFGAFGVDFKTSSVDVALGLALQPDGKIVAAGHYLSGGVPRIAVLRLDRDGNIDPVFTGGTPVLNPLTVSDIATDIVLDPQGRIVLSVTADMGTSKDFAVVRLDSIGNLDGTFFGTGVGWSSLDIGFDSADDTSSVLLQPDDNIVVAGTSDGNFAVARFTPSGAVDLFGAGGKATHDFGAPDAAHDVALDAGGNLVVAGQARGSSVDFGVARFTSAGGLDLSFTNDVTPSDDIAFAVEILSSGKILLGGTSGAPASRVGTLALFNPDGTQDCDELVLHPIANSVNTFALNCPAAWDCVNDQVINIDEGPVEPPDEDTTIIQGTAPGMPGLQELFELVDGKLPAGKVVTELEVVARMRWLGGASEPQVQLMVTRGGFGPDLFGPLETISNIAYLDFAARFTGLNMSGAELDALRIGLEYSGGQGVGVTQLYVRAVYGERLLHPVRVFTATATGDALEGRVLLNWLNPSSGLYHQTVVNRVTGCPAAAGTGTNVATIAGGLGQSGTAIDSGLFNDTPYFYAAFVEDVDGNSSPGFCIDATPFDATAGKVDWIYRTGIAVMTTPGLRVGGGESVAYTVANDGVVHAVVGGEVGTGGGVWPSGWTPPRLGTAAPERPVIMPLPPSNQLAVVTGGEDGRVYVVDAMTGALLWRSAVLGSMIVGSPSAALTFFGATRDFVFIGTRMFGQRNRLYALNANDGTVAWSFDNPGGPDMGMIVSTAVIDYATEQVYFTSFGGASGNSLWCLDYVASNATTMAGCPGWPDFGVAVPSGGDVATSPILYKGSLYVSDISPGDLYQVDPGSGVAISIDTLGGSGVNGYVFPKFNIDLVLASNDSDLHAIDTLGGGVIWSRSSNAPSTPLHVPGSDRVYVGTIDGLLRQYSAAVGGAPVDECIGDCSTTQVGSPAYDVLRKMMYVGTGDGEVFGVRTPF